MRKIQPNIYQLARTGAGLSRERAAELLDLSVSSLKAYENDETVPPNETVVLMTRRYGANWLPIKHLQISSGPLNVVPNITVQELATATLQLINRMAAFADKYRRLMQIAEDGTIDETEQADFAEISDELSDIIASAWQVIYAKKERPETATSKRSRSQRSSENHCTDSIAQRRLNVNTFRGEVRA